MYPFPYNQANKIRVIKRTNLAQKEKCQGADKSTQSGGRSFEVSENKRVQQTQQRTSHFDEEI